MFNESSDIGSIQLFEKQDIYVFLQKEKSIKKTYPSNDKQLINLTLFLRCNPRTDISVTEHPPKLFVLLKTNKIWKF